MRWLLLACSLAVGSWGYSQARDYPFTRLAGQDGLSNNHINVIFKDKEGFVWIGTNSGLNRYDGYTFKVFRHDDQDPASLTDDHVGGIFEGPDNKLYINTGTGGLNIYDPVTGRFEPHRTAYLTANHIPAYNLVTLLKGKDSKFYFVYSDSGVYRYDPVRGAVRIRSVIAENPVEDAGIDGSGAFWLSYFDGLLERLDPERGTVMLQTDVLKRQAQRAPYGYKLYIDGQDQMWLYAMDNLSGLWVFDPHTGGIRHFLRDSGTVRLSNNNISDVVQDDRGFIWIATDKGGIDLLDKGKMTVRYLQHSDEERSLPENTITSLFCDNTGGVWVGTLKKGVAYYQQNVLRFPLYRHQAGQAGSLPYNDVNCFAEDAKGNLWIGTDGGGLIYFDRAGNRWLQYRHEKNDPNSIAGDVIISLLVDRRGGLWVGMYQGGLDRYDGRAFTHFRHRDQDSGSLADDGVYSLLEDAEGTMWVGTMRGGLDRMDVAKGRFYHNTVAMQHSIHSNYIPALAEDRASNLWVGTSYGVNVLTRNTGQYIYYTTENSRLSDNIIFSLCSDRRGNMWVGTRRGLSVMRPGSDSFQVFTVKDGLPGNTIASVQEDGDGNLWVSSSGGLSKVGVTEDGQRLKIKCLNFDEYDGLQGREFNVGAGFRTRGGELAFGGPEGFNLFRPESIGLDNRAPPVVLTGLQLYNKEVTLPPSVGKDGELTLSYDQNNFTLEFAALSYINARKDRYAYRLEPFDRDWMTTDGRSRKAVYTNIDPGEYIFRVKASNSDGVWNDRGIALRVVVKSPWWKTGLAYAAYVIVVLLVLYLARMRIIRRARARFALTEERREAMRVHELDRMKIKFFTNLSHEFRTPLSLILSPVDRLIRGAEDPGRRQLAMTIERNAKRLLHLVNQLLDLRKMETNELKLNMGRGDMASFIRATVDSFSDLAGERGIALRYESEVEQLPALFDRDKVERIFFNLLSNAFKFTPTGGSIGVRLAVLERDEKGALLEIRVSDNGIGIPAELQGRIFESFFQGDSPGHMRSQGTGIGLAITREFVEMHGGTIKVESEPDKGSCFTVLLPVELVAGGAREVVAGGAGDQDGRSPVVTAANGSAKPEASSPVAEGTGSVAGEVQFPGNGGKRFKVLLVEDDEDFRFYLKDNLAPLFTVLEAANGREGWQKALSAQPDLVISDVNMPLMDGLELSKKIKGDERVRHIPVVLLTALSGEQEQLKALGMGVNDYISKPFNVEILISRIRNLLEFRGSVEETLKRRVVVEPAEVEVEPERTDEDFVREAVGVLEKNIANADFSVDEWARKMGLSRTSMYKKILSCTGKTPIGFIRSFRMQRAAQLLEKGRHNVAEVAYMVGFNNPKYFARYFKELYGVLPSVYQAEKRGK